MQRNTVNIRHQAISAIERTLADEEIDDILGPADNLIKRIANVATAAGYPLPSMPLGLTEFNARAFGKLLNTSREHGSGDIRGDRGAWEAILGA